MVEGEVTCKEELSQLQEQVGFKAVVVKELTRLERKRAQEGLMLLTRKHTGKCKGRLAYNGAPTHDWISSDIKAAQQL